MKTATDWLNENGYGDTFQWFRGQVYEVMASFQAEHDKELTTKIKELKEEETNFHAIEVLDKIIKMVG